MAISSFPPRGVLSQAEDRLEVWVAFDGLGKCLHRVPPQSELAELDVHLDMWNQRGGNVGVVSLHVVHAAIVQAVYVK